MTITTLQKYQPTNYYDQYGRTDNGETFYKETMQIIIDQHWIRQNKLRIIQQIHVLTIVFQEIHAVYINKRNGR